MSRYRETPLGSLLAAITPLLLLVAAACGGHPSSPNPAPSSTTPVTALDTTNALFTSDPGYVQIDSCPPATGIGTAGCAGQAWAGDANLYGPSAGTTTDPAGPDADLNLTTNLPSNSTNFPGASGSPFIDWLDLVVDPNKPTDNGRFLNHFRSDYTAGTDPSAFPQSNSCVGSANVLDKMNLTFVSVSNNPQYAYFGVQRRDNSGDAGYMWIFNRLPPPSFADSGAAEMGTGGCSATQYPLVFKVGSSDVLFRGHFAPSADEPLLTVYNVQFPITATTTVADGNTVFSAALDSATNTYYVQMPAKSAISWGLTVNDTANPNPKGAVCDPTGLPGLAYCFWNPNAGAIAGAAVNTSIAGLGALGDTTNAITGGIGKVGINGWLANGQTEKIGTGQNAVTWKCTDSVGGCMPENLFAEVAVNINTFLSGGSVCGATFYGSVISRPSGNTPSSDMKDLAGPFQFNFGNPTVTQVVTPTCGSGTSAQVKSHLGTYTGATGGSITPSSCKWFIDCPTNGTACNITTPVACDFSSTPTSDCYFSTSCSTTDVTSTIPSGSHYITLYVTDNVCPATATPNSVTVNPPPIVTPSMTAGCTNYGTSTTPLTGYSFDSGSTSANPKTLVYYGTPTFAWSFTGAGSYTGSATTASGSIQNAPAGTAGSAINGSLTLYDKRTGVAGVTCSGTDTATDCCTASGTASAIPYLPINVSIAPSSSGFLCNGVTSCNGVSATLNAWGAGTPPSDAITFNPTITGGSGHFTYAWTAPSCTEGDLLHSTCTFGAGANTFCASNTFQLTVTDQCQGANTITGCPAIGNSCVPGTSNQSHYSKITQVYAY